VNDDAAVAGWHRQPVRVAACALGFTTPATQCSRRRSTPEHIGALAGFLCRRR
jgi:hypothetical protein